MQERDFDNPLPRKHLEGRGGGSRSPARRVTIDLEHFRSSAPQWPLLRSAFGSGPMAAWYPAPPGVAGMPSVLGAAKAGWPVERWFSQPEVRGPASSTRDVLVTATTVMASRLWGPQALPWPEYAPLAEAGKVVRWLAEKSRAGEPGWVVTYPSAAVQAAAVAVQQGDDISGSVFILGGEPYTSHKAAVVERTGARGISGDGTTEVGAIGTPCARAEAPDEVHLLSDRVAISTRPVDVSGTTLEALFVTTLLESAPKLMLNVELGDYGVLKERECGCAIGAAALGVHLHSIRSYEKLTTRGITFLGDELLTVLHGVLPERFGGTPEDFQLIEEEASDGVPHLTLVVSSRLGELAEEALVQTVLDELSRGGRAQRMMAESWRSAGALRVARRDPELTSGGKVQPLHLRTSAVR